MKNNCFNYRRLLFSLATAGWSILTFPALSTSAATPYIKPEIKINIDNIFNRLKQSQINNIDNGLAADNTYVLYTTQEYTINILHYAIAINDYPILSDLADIYLSAYSHLQAKDRAIYFYWPGDNYESVHDIVDKNGNKITVKMWLGTPKTIGSETLGAETVMNSAQFLHAVATLCNAILAIDVNNRTVSMNNLVSSYAPILLSHYKRWLFSQNGLFQITGWGGIAGLYNHKDFIAAKNDGSFIGNLSYFNILTGTDLLILAGTVEFLAANSKDASLMPIDSTTKNEMLNYVSSVNGVFATRLTNSNLTGFDNTTATSGINIDLGKWDDHPTYAYSGYTGSTSPSGLPIQPAINVGWDISHARKFIHILYSLYNNHNITGQNFPDTTVMTQFTNQFLYGAFNKNLTEPLFTNFLDGTNGWYRVDYSDECPGYAPFELSWAAFTGGYMFLTEFNPDVTLLRDNFWEMYSSIYNQDCSGHYINIIAPPTTAYGNGNPTSNRYLEITNDDNVSPKIKSLLASTTGTIEFWFKQDTAAKYDLIYIGGENDYVDFLLLRSYPDNTLTLFISHNNVYPVNLKTTTTFTVGKWNHVAITQAGNGAKIYLNGQLASPTNASDYWTNHLDIKNFMIGDGLWNHHFIGALDELHFYSAALTATEIANNYHQARLLEYWTFDNSANYLYNNSTTVAGIKGDGAAFNGNDQYIAAYPDANLSSNTGSISLWFKPTAGTTGDLIELWDNSCVDFLLVRYLSDGRIMLMIDDNAVMKTLLYTTTAVQADTWHHLAITQTGAGSKIYIDGTLSSTTGTNSTYWTNHLNINYVWLGHSNWNYYSGSLDEVAFYQGVLSPGTIAQKYGNGLADGKKLVNISFDSSKDDYIFTNTTIDYNGKICNAAIFNGSDQYIAAYPDANLSSNTGSISLWFKPTAGTTGDLIELWDNSCVDFLLVRYLSDGRIMLMIDDDAVIKTLLYTTTAVQADTWHHLAITQTGAGSKIYIDGALSSTTGTNSTYWTNHLNINYAWVGHSNWNYYSGSLDEVQLYNYAIDQNDITREYRRSDMFVGWDFDEIQDVTNSNFITTYYSTAIATNPLYLLMFLPGFLEYKD